MAAFRIDQVTPGAGTAGQSRHDLVAGEIISLVVTAPVGAGVTYLWELLDKVGSVAVLSSTTASTTTIGNAGAIVAPCGFLIRLTANDNGTVTVSERICTVRTAITGLRPLLFPETAPTTNRFSTNTPDLSTDNAQYADLAGTGLSGQNWRGWAQAFFEVLEVIEGMSGGGFIPSGPAGGDITGTYPNLIVVDGLQGRTLASTAPVDGEAVVWSATNNRWQPGSPGTGFANKVENDTLTPGVLNIVATSGATGGDCLLNLPALTANASLWIKKVPGGFTESITIDPPGGVVVEDGAAGVAFQLPNSDSPDDAAPGWKLMYNHATTTWYVSLGPQDTTYKGTFHTVPTAKTIEVPENRQYMVKGPLSLAGDSVIILRAGAQLAVTTANGLIGPQGPPGSEASVTFEAVRLALAAANTAVDFNAQKITDVATGTANTDAVNVGQLQQPAARTVSGTTDTIVAGDIGNIVMYSQAGGVEAELGDLSASLIAGRAIVLTFQCTNAATILTIDPGVGVTIDGGAGNFVATTGKSRVSLISVDGLAFYSGTP